MAWIWKTCFCAVALVSISTKAASQLSGSLRYMESYSVEGLTLGMTVVPESWQYKRYDCKASDQYANSTWCLFLDEHRHVTLSILHSSDTNIAYYINEAWSRTPIDKLKADREIAQWATLYGMPRRIYKLPERHGFPKAIIATWGGIEFEPLTPSDLHLRAEGRNPYVGIMVDFLNNSARSAQAGLPVYSLSGSSGFVYVASFDRKGEGTRRFFAADPSKMKLGAAEPHEIAPLPWCGSSTSPELCNQYRTPHYNTRGPQREPQAEAVIAGDVIVVNNSCIPITEFRLNGLRQSRTIGPGETVNYQEANQCLHTLYAASNDGKTWTRNFSQCHVNGPYINYTWTLTATNHPPVTATLPEDSLIVENSSRIDNSGGQVTITSKLDCVVIENFVANRGNCANRIQLPKVLKFGQTLTYYYFPPCSKVLELEITTDQGNTTFSWE